MTKRLPTPMLLACLALGVACEPQWSTLERPAERPAERPVERPSVFSFLEILPSVGGLSVVTPGQTLQLTIQASDESGKLLTSDEAPVFASDAPSIARVGSGGVVTAVARGTAVIRASLTLGGITRTAFTIVTVNDDDGDQGIAGVYDLTAVITASDPIWGIESGTRQIAVMTIRDDGGQPRVFTGTYADLQAVQPTEEPLSGSGIPGGLRGTIDPGGLVVLQLFSDASKALDVSQYGFWSGEGVIARGQMMGRFGCCGHIGGIFAAQRRKTP